MKEHIKITIANCVFDDKSKKRQEPIITVPVDGWRDSLTIIGNCFKSVNGIPFAPSANDIQENKFDPNIRPRKCRTMTITSNYVFYRQDGLSRYLR